jgi:hypothetical protein
MARGAIVFNQGERWQFWPTGFAVRFEVGERRNIFWRRGFRKTEFETV